MVDELKPCPGCGVWPEAQHETERGKPQHYVGCCDCGISSKRFPTEAEAATAWNAMCDCCESSEPTATDERVRQAAVAIHMVRWEEEAPATPFPEELEWARAALSTKAVEPSRQDDDDDGAPYEADGFLAIDHGPKGITK